MPWTETSMHFSSQCLNQGVKIFLFFFFNYFYCFCIHCMPRARPKKKKKGSSETALGDIRPWLCVHKPSPLLWNTDSFMSACAGLCGFVSSGKGWFLYQLGYIFPSGHNFPFPWAEVSGCGKGHRCPQKAPSWVGCAGALWAEFNVDFSCDDAVKIHLVRIH